MHVFRTEWLVTLPCKLAFFAAVERNLPISFLPKGTSHVSHIVIWFPLMFNGALMSRNARDDKNGRFGERALQLTMLAKLAILVIFCQFRQIS